jgi:hypothetical protein
MQPFGLTPAFEDGDLKLIGKVYINLYATADVQYLICLMYVHDLLFFIL